MVSTGENANIGKAQMFSPLCPNLAGFKDTLCTVHTSVTTSGAELIANHRSHLGLVQTNPEWCPCILWDYKSLKFHKNCQNHQRNTGTRQYSKSNGWSHTKKSHAIWIRAIILLGSCKAQEVEERYANGNSSQDRKLSCPPFSLSAFLYFSFLVLLPCHSILLSSRVRETG